MKKMISLTLFFLFALSAAGTHNRGGVITYRHISGKTFEATITTFTRSSVAADRCELELFWGDGSSDTLSRVNGPTGACPNAKMGEFIGNDVQMNVYVGTHIYAADGSYTLSIEDPNRNAGIINIPQSVSVPFALNSKLIVDTADSSSSAEFLAPLLMNHELGKPFSFNPLAYDPDGDILTFELVEPLSSTGSVAGSIPSGVSIDPVNGEVTWVPNQVGQYVLAIKVSSCRNNVENGWVMLDMQVNINAPTVGNKFAELSNWPTDLNGNYSTTITPGDNLNLSLEYQDSIATSVDLTGFSETFFGTGSATFILTSLSSTHKRGDLFWQPDSGAMRCAPYLFTFRGASLTQTHVFEKDATLMVYVRDSSFSYCDSVCSQTFSTVDSEASFPEKQLSIWPNPFSNIATFELRETKGNTSFSLYLYDLNGREVRHVPSFAGHTFVMHRGNLPAGIYFYRISDEAQNTYSGKVMIHD